VNGFKTAMAQLVINLHITHRPKRIGHAFMAEQAEAGTETRAEAKAHACDKPFSSHLLSTVAGMMTQQR